MRLWSLHPSYLDSKGLVALWREGLLARKVLQGETRGYRRHPQLARFRAAHNPVEAIHSYLWLVHDEAVRRGYRFDSAKLVQPRSDVTLQVTAGQMRYEWEHLKRKLEQRDPEHLKRLPPGSPQPHPLFEVVPGEIEHWERASESP